MTVYPEVVRDVRYFTGDVPETWWNARATGVNSTVTVNDGKAELYAETADGVAALDHDDELSYLLADLQSMEYDVELSGVGADTLVAVGFGSARNDDFEAIDVGAFVALKGPTSTTALTVHTDNGTNDTSDVATGKTLTATPIHIKLDLSDGLDDVKVYIDGDRVAAGTTFKLSAASPTQRVQPIIQLHLDTGSSETPTLKVTRFAVQHKLNLGA